MNSQVATSNKKISIEPFGKGRLLNANGSTMPSVSVVMPIYNQEKYVADAVVCVLQQTFRDFEFLIVDDGSTDGSLAIVESFDDPRIRVIRKEHTGFITTLVKGYQEARGRLIARMDSDDLCFSDRLERQVKFLESNPEYAFVGTAYGYVAPNGNCVEPQSRFEWRNIKPSEITLGGRVFGDPTVIFRRDLAEKVGFYDPEFNNENPLWYRLLSESKGAVLGEPLYLYRWLIGSLSKRNSVDLREAHVRIRTKYDPENAVRPKSGTRHGIRKASTGKLRHGLVIYLSAEDRAAAIRLTWDGYKANPFSPTRLKLLIYALLGVTGVRTANMRNAKTGLKPSPSPLTK